MLCYQVAGCFAAPELNGAIPGGIPVVDITENQWASGAVLPPGVITPTVFDPVTGFATRYLKDEWQEITGNVTLKWDPDPDTNAFARYSHGYKPGGFRIGIDVGFSPNPETREEKVEAFEVGLKKNFGPNKRGVMRFSIRATGFKTPSKSASSLSERGGRRMPSAGWDTRSLP